MLSVCQLLDYAAGNGESLASLRLGESLACRMSEMLRLCFSVSEEEMECCKVRLTVMVGPEM